MWFLLACAPPPPGVDACVASGPFDTTGFFRVEARCGQWFLLDPQGEPTLSIGVNAAGPSGDAGLESGIDQYAEAVAAAYATPEDWADEATRRLQNWGFTTAGAWSDDALFLDRLPVAPVLYLSGGDWQSGSVADWHDPSWSRGVADSVAAQVAPLAGNASVQGWFLDNETRWGPDWRGSETLLQLYLALPAEAPGKIVAVDHLLDQLGNVEAVNTALGTTFASRDEMLATLDWDTLDAGDSEPESGLTTTWLEAAADHYFSTTTEAIRGHDPDHLVLCNRDVSVMTRLEVHRAAARYCDVLSINNYTFAEGVAEAAMALSGALDPGDALAAVHDDLANHDLDRPIIVSEYGFRAADAGLPNSWPPIYPTYTTQDERAAAASAYVDTHAAAPWIIGWHWFRWVDEPPDGRFDGEDNNFGLVNLADEPYEAVTTALAGANSRALAARRPPSD
ncbi:MAG: hypothetical protein FJ102_19820 [Deltaproteobacteria bacterium]|nr:hypothetical protein [Deltaproteobacteria bacterium]